MGVNLVIDNVCYIASDTSPLYQILKQSDNYKDLGDTECQISIATYLMGYLPSYKVKLQYIEN